MKNLHEITTIPFAYTWNSLIGQNGHILAGGLSHLYRTERTPSIPRRGEQSRTWWTPWETPTDLLNPVCGPIRTGARNPWLSEYHFSPHCQTCRTWATTRNVEATRTVDLRAQDPWARVDWGTRTFTPDPISGL